MNPGWMNSGMVVDGIRQIKGFDIWPIRVEEHSLRPDETIYKFELLPASPLTFVHHDGRWIQPSRSFETNQGSVPWAVTRLIPKDRVLGFYAHDSAYLSGYIWVSRDEGVTWAKETVTRLEADNLLRLMAVMDPQPLSERRALAIWLGVRIGGWMAWGKQIRPAGDRHPHMRFPVKLE